VNQRESNSKSTHIDSNASGIKRTVLISLAFFIAYYDKRKKKETTYRFLRLKCDNRKKIKLIFC